MPAADPAMIPDASASAPAPCGDRVRPRAIVFDMDGVLVDSEPIHQEACNAILAREGKSLTDEEYASYIGTTIESTWDGLKAQLGLTWEISEYKERYEAEIIARLRRPLARLPGVDRVMALARSRGLAMALASSSLKSWVDATLEGLGLTGAFPVMVTGEEAPNGKPAPDIFLLAAKRLGISPGACLAIEDSTAGTAAAAAAGMCVVGVRTRYTRDIELPGAHVVLDSLEEFPETLVN